MRIQNVIAIRQQKIDPKMDTRAKQALQEQKQIFAIEREEELTEEEQEDVDAFMKWIKVGGWYAEIWRFDTDKHKNWNKRFKQPDDARV